MRYKQAPILFLTLFYTFTVLAENQCDIELGKSQFSKCAACHSIEQKSPPMAGPDLYKIINKPSGSDKEFPYSLALMESPRIWTVEALDAFLKQPMIEIPGTAMAFSGIKKQHQRDALLCFLNGGKDPKQGH